MLSMLEAHKKMSKSPQKLFVIIFLGILLSSASYTCMLPGVQASEVSASQKGLNILQTVFGLNLEEYTITIEENSTTFPWLGDTLMETVYYVLISAERELKLSFTFANGNLQNLCVFENQGVSELKYDTNNIASAQAFLEVYQKYSTKPIFKELSTSLNNIETSKNYTKTINDKELEITVYGDNEVTLKWCYSANGATAPYTKIVALSFTDGYLTSFNDKWDLYPIGSTEVALSREGAIELALEAAKNYDWSMPIGEEVFDPMRFNSIRSISWISLNFDGSLEIDNPRSENILELYPVWCVGIVFNEAFGELYAAEVDIWADTHELRSVHEEYSALAAEWIKTHTEAEEVDPTDPPELSAVSPLNIAPLHIAFLAVVMGMSSVSMFVLFKKRSVLSVSKFRRVSVKVFAVLFGSLLFMMVFLPLIETASASSAGVIWASQSYGAPNPASSSTYPPHISWRKTNNESDRQTYVESFLASNGFISTNGYAAFTNFGANKPQILYQAQYLSTNYDHVAVVVFDHGVVGNPGNVSSSPIPNTEGHYMFEDNHGTIVGYPNAYTTDYGHGVFDVDMYDAFPAGTVHFAFINTCLSADVAQLGQEFSASGYPLSLPFGFTHRTVGHVNTGSTATMMSDDGYARPDAFPQCYIGFPWGSAALDQRLPYDGVSPKWYEWVIFFYYQSLNFDVSVNYALTWASNQQWGCNFATSPLRNGFSAVWPLDLDPPWGDYEDIHPILGCTLAVYGNGDIHLKNFSVSHVVTRPSIIGPLEGDPGVSVSFSAYAVDSLGHRIRYIFDWADGTTTTTGYAASGVPVTVSHTWSTDGGYGVSVRAQCDSGAYGGWSEPYYVAIGDNPWLTIDAWDDYGNEINVVVWVDGQMLLYESPVTVKVAAGWHTVTIHPEIYYYFTLLDSFSDGYGNGELRPIYSNMTLTANYRCYH